MLNLVQSNRLKRVFVEKDINFIQKRFKRLIENNPDICHIYYNPFAVTKKFSHEPKCTIATWSKAKPEIIQFSKGYASKLHRGKKIFNFEISVVENHKHKIILK